MRRLVALLIFALILAPRVSLAVVFTVNTPDLSTGDCSQGGVCSLGAAIHAANQTAEPDEVRFDEGVQTPIFLEGWGLPSIRHSIAFRGFSHPQARSNQGKLVDDAIRPVIISGERLTDSFASAIALEQGVAGVTIEGIEFRGFPQAAINLGYEGPSSDIVVRGCLFRNAGGVTGRNVTNIMIGGENLEDRNLFLDTESGGDVRGEGIVYAGNWVGLNPDGVTAAPVSTYGVELHGDSVVEDNTFVGVRNDDETSGWHSIALVVHGCRNCTVVSNDFGITPSGVIIPNAISIIAGGENSYYANNVIVGSRYYGIAIGGLPVPAVNNVFANNLVGMTRDGRQIPNAYGIVLSGDGTSGNLVTNNLLAFNLWAGIAQGWNILPEYGKASDVNEWVGNTLINNWHLPVDKSQTHGETVDGQDFPLAVEVLQAVNDGRKTLVTVRVAEVAETVEYWTEFCISPSGGSDCWVPIGRMRMLSGEQTIRLPRIRPGYGVSAITTRVAQDGTRSSSESSPAVAVTGPATTVMRNCRVQLRGEGKITIQVLPSGVTYECVGPGRCKYLLPEGSIVKVTIPPGMRVVGTKNPPCWGETCLMLVGRYGRRVMVE